MSITKLKVRLIFFYFANVLAFSLVACASEAPPSFPNCMDNNRFNQSFSFHMGESPDIEILDYFYGTPNCPSFSNPIRLKERGESQQSESTIGPLRRYEKLYVKWRIKSTGQEYSDTVDLRNRLPMDMTNHKVHFSVKGSQLYVYLITPEIRPPDMPANGPREFQEYKTLTIYPNEK